MANTRVLRRIEPGDPAFISSDEKVPDAQRPRKNSAATVRIARTLTGQSVDENHLNPDALYGNDSSNDRKYFCLPSFFSKAGKVLVTFCKFVGPGFMVGTPLLVQADDAQQVLPVANIS
jgi:metal iron transporter